MEKWQKFHKHDLNESPEQHFQSNLLNIENKQILREKEEAIRTPALESICCVGSYLPANICCLRTEGEDMNNVSRTIIRTNQHSPRLSLTNLLYWN